MDGKRYPAPSGAGQMRKRTLGTVFFIMLMDVVGFSILSPVTPYIVQRYSSAAVHITLLSAIYAAAQFFAAPYLGKLSDRFGRRPVLLLSVFGSGIGYLMFGFGGALWILFLSRLIDGVTGGNMSTAIAFIADLSTREGRAKSFVLVGLAYGLGFVLGPALGGLFSQISLDAPAFAAAGLALLQVLLTYLVLPESLPKARRISSPLRLRDLNPLASTRQVMSKPGLARLLTVQCLYNFAFSGLNVILAVYVIHKFNVEPWQIGVLFVVAGIAIIIAQGVLAHVLVTKFGEKSLATGSFIGQTLSTVAFIFTPTVLLLYVVSLVRSALTGLVFPSLGAMISKGVSEREQGLLQGVSVGLNSLVSVFGPLVMGAVYDRVSPGAPLWLAAGILALAALALTTVKTPAGSTEYSSQKVPG